MTTCPDTSERCHKCSKPLMCHRALFNVPQDKGGAYPGGCSSKGACLLVLIHGFRLALGLAGLAKVLGAQCLCFLALQPQCFRLLLFRSLLVIRLRICSMFSADIL